jgi:hypothetical protein
LHGPRAYTWCEMEVLSSQPSVTLAVY